MSRTFNPQDAMADDPFEVLPVGKYVVRVKELEKRKGKSDDYLNLTLTVLAGPIEKHPIDKKQTLSGRLMWEILSYSPGAQARLGQAFIAVGHPHPPKNLDDMAEMRNEVFQGRTAIVSVKHEEYQGNKKARVARWHVPTGPVLEKWPHRPPRSGSDAPDDFASSEAPPTSEGDGGEGGYEDDTIPF